MRYKLFILILLILSSCASKKNILLVQDLENNDNFIVGFDEYKVKTDDILKIDVTTENQELSSVYNKNQIGTTPSRETMLLEGYQVSLDGTINFPMLGELDVDNKTLSEISKLIYISLVEKGILINPSIDVKVINSHFVILGEVNRPGRYNYESNNMNILNAIGMAGGLSIFGKRDDIKLIRTINNNQHVTKIDLTNSNFIKSGNFQLISGDIIIVNPNKSRVANSGLIGDSGKLLSLLSFVLSSIIVISR